MASGWNLWVWLQCIGVASGCCCKEVYRYPHNYYFPYSTCISSFFGSSIPTSLFIFKCFFGLVYVIFVQYIANFTQRTFEIVQKNRDHANITSKRYSVGARLSGRTTNGLYVLLCSYIRSQATHRYISRSGASYEEPISSYSLELK